MTTVGGIKSDITAGERCIGCLAVLPLKRLSSIARFVKWLFLGFSLASLCPYSVI